MIDRQAATATKTVDAAGDVAHFVRDRSPTDEDVRASKWATPAAATFYAFVRAAETVVFGAMVMAVVVGAAIVADILAHR